MALSGIGVDERWSEPDGLVKYFWEFIGKRLEHIPPRSFHPRIAQAEQEAEVDSERLFRIIEEKLGREFMYEVENAKNAALGVCMDTAYIQGLQDGLLLGEKMRTGLVAWLAEAFPISSKIERPQEADAEEASV